MDDTPALGVPGPGWLNRDRQDYRARLGRACGDAGQWSPARRSGPGRMEEQVYAFRERGGLRNLASIESLPGAAEHRVSGLTRPDLCPDDQGRGHARRACPRLTVAPGGSESYAEPTREAHR